MKARPKTLCCAPSSVAGTIARRASRCPSAGGCDACNAVFTRLIQRHRANGAHKAVQVPRKGISSACRTNQHPHLLPPWPAQHWPVLCSLAQPFGPGVSCMVSVPHSLGKTLPSLNCYPGVLGSMCLHLLCGNAHQIEH